MRTVISAGVLLFLCFPGLIQAQPTPTMLPPADPNPLPAGDSPARLRPQVDVSGIPLQSEIQRTDHRLLPPSQPQVERPVSPPSALISRSALAITDAGPVPPLGAAASVEVGEADYEQIMAAPIDQNGCCFGPRYWFNGEYLMWWIKDSPLPFPVVTTSINPGTDTAGALGESSTSVLHGGKDIDLGMFSGIRLAGGAWLDRNGFWGVEGVLFFLECNDAKFVAASNGDGRPPLYLPAFNTQLQSERALIVADPVAGLAGNVSVISTSELWGAELSAVVNILNNNCNMWIDLLGGFRYLDLDESLELSATTTNLGVGFIDALRDRFGTSNQFYGGQLGMRVSYGAGPWYVNLTQKLGFGTTHEATTISGGVIESGIGATTPGTFPGGFYTQPSNIGQHENNHFSVVPELQVKVGYQFTPGLTAYVAYNFLYWSNVFRPGDQIDRNLNLTQSPVFGATDGVLVGAPNPRPLAIRSDFWTQGISLGLAIRF